jgi:2-amino-4-hydroxy-6-hydroxymethyldihydropteridine diphosphokinase
MSTGVRQGLIGVGANLGDRCATLCGAMERLRARSDITAFESSPVYETEPVGYTDQPPFLNLVFGIETTLEPDALLVALIDCEQHFGRLRTLRWGPRTLDLDLLAFEGETRATTFLQLPHPRMLERAFVTVPLRDVLASTRFQRPGWDELRLRLAALPAPASGLRRYPDCVLR